MQSCFSRSTEPQKCFNCGRKIVRSLNRAQIYMAASMEEVELNAQYLPVFLFFFMGSRQLKDFIWNHYRSKNINESE